MKRNTSVEELWENLPKEIADFMSYWRGLGFEEEPDYERLREILKGLLERKGFECDYEFDWVIEEKKLEAEIEREENKEGYHEEGEV